MSRRRYDRASRALVSAACALSVVSCQTRSPKVPESGSSSAVAAIENRTDDGKYPAHWWEVVPASEAAWWEILPQAARPGEVILSKRNELGLLSNFAATPFAFRGQHYASVEGLWQSMKYPEGPNDPRASDPRVVWEHTRGEVVSMVAFDAKAAGDAAGEKMETMGIDWVTFEGKRLRYRGEDQGRFFEIIAAAMRAKVEQNPEVERVLLATGKLVLRPDHLRDENALPAWRYDEIWMTIRAELRAQ